jgi:hypothetical protein
MLGLSSTVILEPQSLEIITIFYCLRFKAPLTWRARVKYE